MTPAAGRLLLLLQAVALALTAASTGGCIFPGTSNVLEKGIAEMRGGRGESRQISPLPAGPVLDRFRAFKVSRVERSTDAGPMPDTLPKVVETELRNAIRESNLFPGGPGPTLLIRARLTTHWPAAGLLQAVSAHSEILARVELVEDGRRAPLGVYYVRGVSTAIARKSDENLGRGLASAVVELIESHRTAPENPDRLAERTPTDR
jgi:hypothetical protein